MREITIILNDAQAERVAGLPDERVAASIEQYLTYGMYANPVRPLDKTPDIKGNYVFEQV